MSVGVGWGHRLIVPGLILPKPWIMSCLKKMMCSFTLSLSSRTLLAKGQKSGSAVRLSLPNTVILRHKPQLREKVTVTHPDRTVPLGETHSQWGTWGQGAQYTLELRRPCCQLLELKRRCRFSKQVSVGPPPLGWWWVLSTNKAYPFGGPTNPARFQHPWWKALMGNSTYLWHPGRPWTSLGDMQFLASGQMAGLHHHFPGIS